MDEEDDYLDDDLLDDADDTDLAPETGSELESAPDSDPVVKIFREHGFQIPDGIDGKTLMRNVQEIARRQQSMPSEMDLARMREAEARYQQEREPQKTEQPAEKPAKLSRPEGAEQYVVFDDKVGMYVPKDARFPNIKAVEEMNSWHQRVEANKRRLLEDPEGYLQSELKLEDRLAAIKKEAAEEAVKAFQQLQMAEKRESERAAFWDQNAAGLFVLDESGNVATDLNGNPAYSRKGLKYLEFRGELEQTYANADPYVVERKAFEMADKWEKNEKRRQSRAQTRTAEETEVATEVEPEPTPEEVAEKQKQSFTQKARAADESGKRKKGDRVINRDASVVSAAKNGTTQNEGADFVQLWRSEAKARGLIT